MIWVGAVRLREPIQLEGRGWRTYIDEAIDKVALELTDAGYVNIYNDSGGELLTTLGPTLVLQLMPRKVDND